MINFDLPVPFQHQLQALGGHLSYSDRHMVLPVEMSGRLGMGSCCERWRSTCLRTCHRPCMQRSFGRLQLTKWIGTVRSR